MSHIENNKTDRKRVTVLMMLLAVLLVLSPIDLSTAASSFVQPKPAASCSACWGSGECSSCQGTGKDFSGLTCGACDGNKDCYVCAGKGKI